MGQSLVGQGPVLRVFGTGILARIFWPELRRLMAGFGHLDDLNVPVVGIFF